jgi:hypothetical protein
MPPQNRIVCRLCKHVAPLTAQLLKLHATHMKTTPGLSEERILAMDSRGLVCSKCGGKTIRVVQVGAITISETSSDDVEYVDEEERHEEYGQQAVACPTDDKLLIAAILARRNFLYPQELSMIESFAERLRSSDLSFKQLKAGRSIYRKVCRRQGARFVGGGLPS